MKLSLCSLAASLALAATFGLAVQAHAAPPPAEAFFKEADLNEVVLSPSGRRLAFTAQQGKEFRGLVVVDLAAGGKPARVAQFADGDVVDVHWVNEDRLIFGVTDFSEGSGRPVGAAGLYSVNADGTKFKSLVHRLGKPFLSDGGDAKLLDWNHRLLQVPTPKEGEPNDEVLMARFSMDEYRRETPIWLNTRTGRTRTVLIDPPPDVIDWMADSHGELRVALTRHEGRQAAYWRGPGSTKWEQLYDSGLMDRPFSVNSLDDAGNLYVTRGEGASGTNVLIKYDFAKHAPSDKPMFVTPGFDFRGGLIINDGVTLGVRINVDAEATVWFAPAMKALQDKVDEALPGRINRISCRRCGQPDMISLVRSYSDRDPGQVFVYQSKPAAGDVPWHPVGKVREAIDPQQMGQTDFHRIKARDGLDLPVWVTKPADAKGPLPAVVLVHGGPWVRGRFWRWDADAQFLATRGYVVIEPEMRGSTGYGYAHYRAGFKQFGQAMQNDVADALRWAQKQGLASNKACIAGASYGGYSTLMGLINDPDMFRCGVAWLAVTDLDLYVSGSWRVTDDISSAGRKYTLPEMVGDPAKDAEMIAKYSPVKQAARLKSPLLLAFGEDDRRVPIEHGQRMRDALKIAGNDPVWVTYPGEGHGFAVDKNRVDFAQRMEKFLAKYLGPDAPAK